MDLYKVVEVNFNKKDKEKWECIIRNNNSQIIFWIDSKGNHKSYQYDDSQRLIQWFSNNNEQELFEYDSNGNKIKETHIDNNLIITTTRTFK